MENIIVAYVDKTIVKITGINVHGMKPNELEKKVAENIGCPVRVIGVSSDSIQMDVYGLSPEAIMRNEQGIIKTISLVPGLTAMDVAHIVDAKKALQISSEELLQRRRTSCPKQNWVGFDG